MKINQILFRIGCCSEILITTIILFFSYFFVFENLDKADKILLIAVLLVMIVINMTKIPLASAIIYSVKFFYKLLFVIALILVTFSSTETYVQVFELYIVKKNILMNFNVLEYFGLGLIFSTFGTIFAISGLYLGKLEEIKNEKKNERGDVDG